ncbi:hypothetical protein FACS1894166_03000 [Bacilli bacterium]|nr:hypothetical protein FACS1894166_03000 [Bacilli bacterium]
MKKILMALTPILLTGTVGAGMISSNHQMNTLERPIVEIGIQNNDVSTVVNQKVYYDGDDANPNLDGSVTKSIAFSNKLKKIYLPASYTNKIPASNLLMTYSQQTPITNDHKQCGYSNDNDNFNFELNDRVQD